MGRAEVAQTGQTGPKCLRNEAQGCALRAEPRDMLMQQPRDQDGSTHVWTDTCSALLGLFLGLAHRQGSPTRALGMQAKSERQKIVAIARE